MNRLSCTKLPLAGLMLVEYVRLEDNRGGFSRIFCADELRAAGWTKPIAQINHTSTSKLGTVRGLHYQEKPYTEMKMITCLRGEVWDVAVDLRVNSPTLMQWHSEVLTEDNRRAVLIPEGFAHGFQALTDDVELLYFHSAEYSPKDARGINPLEQRLAIAWPLKITCLSKRDKSHPPLESSYSGILI